MTATFPENHPIEAMPRHILDIQVNQICDIADMARTDPEVIKLWIGEGDLPTPDFICDAAVAALHAGHTRYTYALGVPELRAALARYHSRHWDIEINPSRFSSTIGGINAIMQAFQSILRPGDEVVIPTPAWPNILEVVAIAGGTARPVIQRIGDDNRFNLDLDELFSAVTERTRAIAINSPCNPTGWVMSRDQMVQVRGFVRQKGLWLVSDEVYNHFTYDGVVATSFLELCDPDDRLLVTNTFSKNWCMTGWRSGWIIFPEGTGRVFDNLSQYNTTSTPTFLQHGCIAALDHGDAFIKSNVARCAETRRIFRDGLAGLSSVIIHPPDGTFYLTLEVKGAVDGFAVAVRMLREAGVGIAPGSAFGEGGDSFMRLCFAVSPDLAREAVARMRPFLEQL